MEITFQTVQQTVGLQKEKKRLQQEEEEEKQNNMAELSIDGEPVVASLQCSYCRGVGHNRRTCKILKVSAQLSDAKQSPCAGVARKRPLASRAANNIFK